MKVQGADSLIRKLKQLREATTGAGWARSARIGAKEGRNLVREKAPKKTGKYARSIKEKQQDKRRAQVSYNIGTDDVRGMPLEYGSGTHATGPGATRQPIPIVARDGGVLAFPWANAPAGLVSRGGMFFFRKVMHPGIRPQPHFRPTVDDDRDKIVGAIVASQRKEIREAIR